MSNHSPLPLKGDEYITIIWDKDLNFLVYFDSLLIYLFISVIVVFIGLKMAGRNFGVGSWRTFEIDEAQFGLGDQKITLRPNDTDRQIAYKIWVELSTRKIGLNIDLDNDVISEIYDSWYTFFSVTRDLLKDVPVAKFRRKDTEKIIHLSIEVLNIGLRPHLTEHQARFRDWWRRASEAEPELTPQERQRAYPHYDALVSDMRRVNQGLMELAENLRRLAHDREIESLGVRLVRIAYPRYKK